MMPFSKPKIVGIGRRGDGFLVGCLDFNWVSRTEGKLLIWAPFASSRYEDYLSLHGDSTGPYTLLQIVIRTTLGTSIRVNCQMLVHDTFCCGVPRYVQRTSTCEEDEYQLI